MKKYILEITVFVCGAVVMIFELVGSRIFAPYLGTSSFVWTSLIGVILGSLSIGYWLGGKMADKKPSFKNFSFIILISAILIGIIIFIKDDALKLLTLTITDIRWGAVLGGIFLFAPASVFLGAVSPYAVKLKMESLSNTGRTVGNLYALSTLGSIVGTFLAGFFLIPHFSITSILYLLSAILLSISFMVLPKKNLVIKILFYTFFCIILLFLFLWKPQKDFIEINTVYNLVRIYDDQDEKTGRPIKIMKINNEPNSAMFLDGDGLVFDYTKYYNLAKHFNPYFKKSLMIGGGAYSYPKEYLKKFPDAKIDVVEIDPELTQIAKEHFNLKNNPRLKIYHEDGRIFLNNTKNKYDIFFGDAFKSFYSIPYQLTTIEAIQKIYSSLNSNGVAIINIVSSMNGVRSSFLQAEYKTFKNIFPQVYIFPVGGIKEDNQPQNIILVALKSDQIPSFESEDNELNEYLKHLWKKNIVSDLPILKDNYAPVEHYLSKALFR